MGWRNGKTSMFLSWFQISADSWEYRIGFWGIQYDINRIISADIRAGIVDIANIDDIDIKNYSLIEIPALRFYS